MKRCSKCKIEKGVSEFYKDPGHKDGLQSHCRGCISVFKAKQYLESKAGFAKNRRNIILPLKVILDIFLRG